MKLRVMLAIALVLLVVGACRRQPTPTVEPTAEAAGPQLTAERPLVEFREREMDPGRTLEPGETVAVAPGANLIVRDNGRAKLEWPEFLLHELLNDTDTLLSLSQPDLRYVILDQASGTARYTLAGAGEKADLQVKAGGIVDLQVTEGTADVIVSLVPGEEPVAWVVVLDGQAQVTRSRAENIATEEADTSGQLKDSLTISAGQAAAITKTGDMPTVLDIDPAAVRAWYAAAAEGTAESSIAAVTFRCIVVADQTSLLGAPSAQAAPVGSALRKDTLLAISQRDDTGQWLKGQPLASAQVGWVPVSAVACLGPVAIVSGTAPGQAGGSPTPTLPLRRTPLATRTLGPAVAATATRTATPAAAQISFGADDDELLPGECTLLRWDVENIREVYLDGEGVAGQGQKRVCPSRTTTYTLRVVLVDGSVQERSVTVHVTPPAATNTSPPPPPTNTSPPPPPTNTPPPPPTDTSPPPPPSDTPAPPAATPTP
jgi:hypothetical protein